MSIVESPWIHQLIMSRDPKIKFPTHKQLMKDHIPSLFAKTMEYYVLFALMKCTTTSVTFDLWMNKTRFDTFVLIVNFIDDAWVPINATFELFETPNIMPRDNPCRICEASSSKIQLTKKVIAYVKGEGSNLNTLATTLSFVVLCAPLQLVGWTFKHIMNMFCEYVTNDTKIFIVMGEVSLKTT